MTKPRRKKHPAKAEITTAMVLAAGRGTRMRHLSEARPKPLVEVAGRALIDHVLDRLANAGIGRAVVNVHTKADMVQAALAGRTAPQIIISDERAELLETGGGVAKALDLIGDEAFIVQNSDCIWLDGFGDNITRLKLAFDPKHMDALLLVTSALDTVGYDGIGDFQMDALGRLTRRASAQPVPFVFTGASIATRRLFDGCPDGAFSMNVLWDRAAKAGRLYGVRMDGVWMHVGTPEAVEEAEARLAIEAAFTPV